MNNKYYIGNKAKSITMGARLEPVSKIVLSGENDSVFVSGDDSGYSFEVYVPNATQQMADDMLEKARGFKYQGYTASCVYIPPEAELGDGISIQGGYGILAKREFSFTPKMSSNIESPYSDEIENEYTYTGTYAQEVANRVKLGNFYNGVKITKKDGITIVKTDGETATARAIFNSEKIAFYNADGSEAFYFDSAENVFKVTQYADIEEALEGSTAWSQMVLTSEQYGVSIQDLEDNYTNLQLYVNSITLSVSNKETSSTIQLKAGDTLISSENITMSGLVTYTGLSGGTTTIDGACIKTGTIAAARLNLTGAISWSDLDANVRTDISSAYNNASDALEAANNLANGSGSGTFINGTTVQSPYIVGGNVVGSVISFGASGTVGTLYYTQGSDGVSVTDLIELNSSAGIVLSAATGMRFEGSSLWINIDFQNIYVKRSGSWVSLNQLVGG